MAAKDRTWDDVRAVLPHASRMLLYGPPGTGKTTLGFADRDDVYYVPLHEDSTVAELIGFFMPVGDRFVWFDGPVLMAWKNGARIILDEIDKASGAVLTVCRAVLNDPNIAQLLVPDPSLATLSDDELAAMIADGEGQRVVRPAEGFQALACMNAELEDLDPEGALQDRFDAVFRIAAPHPDAISALPDDLQSAADAAARQEDPERRIGLRRWKAFAALREKVSEDIAARAVFGSRAGDVADALKLARNVADALKPARKAEGPNITAAVSEASTDIAEADIPKVYPVVTGSSGKPPLFECDRHGRLTHRSGIVNGDDGSLRCRRCDEIPSRRLKDGRIIRATRGNFRVRCFRNGEWVTQDA